MDDQVTVQCSRQLIFGPGGMREGIKGTGGRVARLYTNKEFGTLIKVESHMVTFKGLSLEGLGRITKEQPNGDITAIEFRKRSNTDDVDGRVLECVLRKFATGIRVVGRGFRAEQNVFFSITGGIQLAWPGEGVMRNDEDDPFKFSRHNFS
jgi:hypothetical protein